MKSMKLGVALAAAIAFAPAMVSADEGADLYNSKGCVGCHGADGNTTTTPATPKIAGQNKEYAVQQMKDYKSGDRSNGQAATMKGILAAVTEEEIDKIATYLAGLK